jgi:hypothetical protein
MGSDLGQFDQTGQSGSDKKYLSSLEISGLSLFSWSLELEGYTNLSRF